MIQINVPRNQAVVIMDGENVIGVLATHQIMKGWERKHMADYILPPKRKKGKEIKMDNDKPKRYPVRWHTTGRIGTQ